MSGCTLGRSTDTVPAPKGLQNEGVCSRVNSIRFVCLFVFCCCEVSGLAEHQCDSKYFFLVICLLFIKVSIILHLIMRSLQET